MKKEKQISRTCKYCGIHYSDTLFLETSMCNSCIKQSRKNMGVITEDEIINKQTGLVQRKLQIV